MVSNPGLKKGMNFLLRITPLLVLIVAVLRVHILETRLNKMLEVKSNFTALYWVELNKSLLVYQQW